MKSRTNEEERIITTNHKNNNRSQFLPFYFYIK